MPSHALPSTESKKSTATASTASAQRQEKDALQLVDNRAETALQRKFAGIANSPSYSPQAFSNQAAPPAIQKKENNTGLPDQLKSGIENLSGYSMDDVRVHRNSDQPAQLQAHAFAQGADIHLAPGQEKQLPHEAWHVVQQKQGKVKPTLQLKKEKVKVNDDAALEKEATVMGSKAYTETPEPAPEPIREEINSDPWAQIVQRKIHVKSGEKFDTTVPEITAPDLVTIAKSPHIFYVQSMADIGRMKASEDVPVLENKKHLIGEEHNQSRFGEAVNNWGWSSQLVIEKYSSHEKLKSPAQEKQKKAAKPSSGQYDEEHIKANATALEDTAAKGLTLATNSKIFGAKLLKMSGDMHDAEQFATLDPVVIRDLCTAAWHKCEGLMDVTLTLTSYLLESSKSTFFYDKEHDLVKSVLNAQLINGVGEGLDNIREQREDTTRPILNAAILNEFINSADKLIPVMQKLIVAYDSKGFSLEEIQGMTTKAIDNSSIGELNNLRERYMLQNIKGARVPSLVKIGRKHVTNIGKNPPADSKLYNDSTNFETENMASTVQR